MIMRVGVQVRETRLAPRAGQLLMQSAFNSSYTRNPTEGGPCRSEFSAQISTIEPYWLKGLTSQKNFQTGPAVLEIWPFLDFGHTMRPKLEQ